MIRIATILFTVSILFGSCSSKRPDAPQQVIAFAINTLNNPFFVDMKRGAEDAAKELGVALVVQATEREMDVERQMQIVENFLQRNVQVICLTPNGSREVIPAILKANRQGVPMVIVDSKVEVQALQEAGGTIAAFVGSDNVEGGRLAGEFIVKQLNGRGSIAILEGPGGHETGDSRLRGFNSAIRLGTGITVAASQLASFDRGQGYTVFQNILQAHPNLRAVFACNDLMALGAIEAIAAAGKTGSILVVGFDAIEEARVAIREGRMHATIAQYPYDMGRRAVETAAKLLAGEQVNPMIPTRIELKTKENINEE